MVLCGSAFFGESGSQIHLTIKQRRRLPDDPFLCGKIRR